MTIRDLYNLNMFEIVVEPPNWYRIISGYSVCDLLSHVISHTHKDALWITVTSHANVVAVAVMQDLSCVILADNVVPDKDMLKAALEHKICILKSEKSAFDIVGAIYGTLN